MSPKRILCFRLGALPLIPIIKPILTLKKLYSMSLTTLTIENMPYSPLGKTAITTLYFPTFPNI